MTEAIAPGAEKLFADFCTFANGQLSSGDLDPTYPLLKEVYKAEALSPERALWRTLLYVTWYSLGSASTVWDKYPDPLLPKPEDVQGLSTGTERRGFRGNLLSLVHLEKVLDASGGDLVSWMKHLTRSGGVEGWDSFREEFQKIPHAGPWTSYKFADLLAHVHDFPITASDLGVGGGSETAGPIPGMTRLTGRSWKECATSLSLQRDLLGDSMAAKVAFTGLDQLETALCDFNSLCKGNYYCGHDIDLQMEHLPARQASIPFQSEVVETSPFWKARERVFHDSWLGEKSGWFGVRSSFKPIYRDTGRVLLVGSMTGLSDSQK